MDDDLEHLQPGFDPSTLTIPKLRLLLLTYKVDYVSSAKKSQLVDLFNEHIAPQAKHVLAARKRTKPSVRGIKDVPSSQASVVDGEEEEEMPPPPPPPKTVKRPKAQRATSFPAEVRSEQAEEAPSRRASSKHARSSDVDADLQPARRRSRKSAATASVAKETVGPAAANREDGETPFSTENPFQSGSSPPPDNAHGVRRKSRLSSEQKEKRKSGEHRRRTTQTFVAPQADGPAPPSRRTFEMPVVLLRKNAALEPEGVEVTEEFTPEEQLELVRERAKSGELDILPPRRKKKSQSTGTAKVAVSSILVAVLGGLAALWTREKFQVGYCGIGNPSTEIGGVQIPEWAKVALPQCEPCPPHAYCYENLLTNCEADFVLRHHPLSVGGLIPLPPSCEPDSDKLKRVKMVEDKVIDMLRQRKAAAECGEAVDEAGKPVTNPEMSVDEIKEHLSKLKRRGLSQEQFDGLFHDAIGDVVSRDEVVSGAYGTLASTSLARLSLSCTLRRYVRQALVRYLGKIVACLIVLVLGAYARHSFTSGRETESRAKKLATDALDRLAHQASLHAHDPQAFPERFIGMYHLRDDILRDEFSASRRAKLWLKVQKKVEQNSNVRPAVREAKTGDVGRVWEWIGPIAAIDDGSTGGRSRRQSGKYSLPAVGMDSVAGSSPLAGHGDSSLQTGNVRGWDQGRPIY